MNPLRAHIAAARAMATAYSIQAHNVRRQIEGRSTEEGPLMLMKSMEAHAAAHSRAAETMEKEADAQDKAAADRAVAEVRRLSGLSSTSQPVDPAPAHWHHPYCGARKGGVLRRACDMDCARDYDGWGKEPS